MSLKAISLLLISFIVSLLVGIGYSYYRLDDFEKFESKFKRSCQISLISDSSVVEVKVQDKKKFNDFIKKYAPCKDGKFTLGNPFTQSGEVKVHQIAILISDFDYGNSTYALDEDGEKVKVHTYDYDFLNPEKAFIMMQFDRKITLIGSFDNVLPFLVAARVFAASNYQNPGAWLDREKTVAVLIPELMKQD